MTSPILWCGGEDFDFQFAGTPPGISGFSNRWRPTYARYAYAYEGNGFDVTVSYITNNVAFSATQFWFSARVFCYTSQVVNQDCTWLKFKDSSYIDRILITTPNGSNAPACQYRVSKVDHLGVKTTLVLTTSGFLVGPSTPDKLDVFINYAVSGQILIYINGYQVFSYSGDVTTDGVTSLSYFSEGCLSAYYGVASAPAWSETIVSTRDTRTFGLWTQAPTGAGNTDNWTGVYSDVNQNTVNQSTPNYTGLNNQVQEYTASNSAPGPQLNVVSVVHKFQVVIDTTGPQHIQSVQRTGGTDYFSSSLSPTTGWLTLNVNWDVNPATLVAWTIPDLTAVGYNIGMKSIA